MLFSTVFDYANGIVMEYLDRREKPQYRKWVLMLSVVVNIGILCFFKYTDFVLESVGTLTGHPLPLLKLALPIGISFYTFQTLSYTIDVYRRKVEAQHNIIDFGMYVCLFPQLIAGTGGEAGRSVHTVHSGLLLGLPKRFFLPIRSVICGRRYQYCRRAT